MSLFKFIKAIVFCTLLALIYIHMQMKIIALAYDGKKREQEIISLSERNGVLAYEILSLKSASNLGDKVLGNQSRMKFCDSENVVRVVSGKPAMASSPVVTSAKVTKINPILNFFAKAGTEANAAEHVAAIKPWRRVR